MLFVKYSCPQYFVSIYWKIFLIYGLSNMINTVSMQARLKCAFVLFVFAVLGVGPIPITSTIGLFVVIFRPYWFKKLINDIYIDKP